jgi:hypothetical protein
VDDARRPEPSPLMDWLSRQLEARGVTPPLNTGYIWGAAGPGPHADHPPWEAAAVTKGGAVVQISSQQWQDLFGFERAIKRAAEIRTYLRGRWAADPISAFPIIRAYCLRVATSELRYRREYEAERCPRCGCHPQEHGDG